MEARAHNGGAEADRGASRSILYVDMAYTVALVRKKEHANFFETRHSGDFFKHVWGVHPLADRAGDQDADDVAPRVIAFTQRQTVIEGVSRSRRLPRVLAPVDFLITQTGLAIRLARLIRRENISLIMATDAVYGGLFAAALKLFSGRPLAIGLYANPKTYRAAKVLLMPRMFPWYWLQSLVIRIVLWNADLIIGGTRNYLDYGIAHGGRKARHAVIPIARYVEPCHMAEPSKRPKPDDLLSELRIPPSDRYMLMVSRLIPVKYAEEGVRAMIAVARSDPGAAGIIAGSGELQPQLEALTREHGVADRIVFVGHVSQQVLSRIAPRCVTLSPLTGMALVETGLAGSPAVAFDADWQPEFVQDGVNGFIVPLGDTHAMAQRVEQIFGDEALRDRMSRAMRDKAFATADRATIAQLERDVFTAVLDTAERRNG